MGNISYIQYGKLWCTCSQSLVKFCWLVYSNSLKGSANYESRCILLLTAHNFLTNSLTQTATTTILQQLHRSTSSQHWKTDFIYRSFTVHTPLLMATSIIRLWGRCQEFTSMVWPALSSYISLIKKIKCLNIHSWCIQRWFDFNVYKLNCAFSALMCLQCFDTVGWVAGRASNL